MEKILTGFLRPAYSSRGHE